MKVLIVDDNVAIQEVLSEVLSVDGNETFVAGSLDEARKALDSFKPDVILLDSMVSNESGLKLIDDIPPDSDVSVVILTEGEEQVPKDTSFITGSISKPFKSTQVLDKVRALSAETAEAKEKKKRFRFFGAGKAPAEQPETESSGLASLKFGRSYVIFESEPETVYKVASYFRSKECEVLIITSGKVKPVVERMKDRSVTVVGLANRAKENYMDVTKLGTLMSFIADFSRRSIKPIVVIDDLMGLVEANGLNSVLTMIYQIINGGSDKQLSLVVSTKQGNLTDKDKDLLLSNMERYMPPEVPQEGPAEPE